MSPDIASLQAFALAFSGMAALAFAMDRHYEQLTRRRQTPYLQRLLLRGLGMALVAAAIVPCILAWGGSVGTVVWLGFLSAGALCQSLLLPYLPRSGATAAVIAAVGGIACFAVLQASPASF